MEMFVILIMNTFESISLLNIFTNLFWIVLDKRNIHTVLTITIVLPKYHVLLKCTTTLTVH